MIVRYPNISINTNSIYTKVYDNKKGSSLLLTVSVHHRSLFLIKWVIIIPQNTAIPAVDKKTVI